MARIVTKQHVRDGTLTLAVCDIDLLGKEFTEGKACLTISENFYKGEETIAEKVKQLLQAAKSATIVGKESTTIAKEVFPDLEIKTCEKIPFANMFRV